ncbi:hypothetical protein Y88_1908 [Novosphingobium nitrogenifigens DSM 19370]|uniref:Uncharacterized protein n=2 Tax=Novosphingobium nitrogenifigens TaxID=378548 RepID=F1Z569_9SPHN|nr:hypothetical protein Y88_1908 [Novosphingobium nitrogenifigens DSM 19370]
MAGTMIPRPVRSPSDYVRLALTLLCGALALPSPAPAQPGAPPSGSAVPQDEVRCAAAFALAATAQAQGDPVARTLPPLGIRGKRYFVAVAERMAARGGLSTEAVGARMSAAAQGLSAPGAATAAARSCLSRLDAEVPPRPKPDTATCSALLDVYADVIAARGGGEPGPTLRLEAHRLAETLREEAKARGKSPADSETALAAARQHVRTALLRNTGEIDADTLAACRH